MTKEQTCMTCDDSSCKANDRRLDESDEDFQARQKMAVEMKVPFLGRVPIDPRVMKSGDDGKPFASHMVDSETAKAFMHIVEPIARLNQAQVN